jgi:magnesium chelatase subunit I
MAQPNIQTLGELKKTGYQALAIHEELRKNLIARIQNKQRVFEGIYGYDETVIPELERAILAGHNILLLGLRGQAKTRIARLLVHLLDEYVPVIKGSPLNEDPLHPISFFGKDIIRIKGDDTPIEWWHRSERYTEKLATPDVSVADLIGDLDELNCLAF